MKKSINNILSKVGFEIRKVEKDPYQLDLYQRCYPKESVNYKRFYNVGAGSFYHPYWTNVDYISDWYKNNSQLTAKGIHYDLFSLKPIPVNDDVAEIVYSSHTIEHIKDEHAGYFFSEAYRMLKNGGLIRITCPDIDLHYRAYVNDDIEFYYWRSWYSKQKDYERIKMNAPLDEASISQLFLQRLSTAASELHMDGAKERISDAELKKVFSEKKYEEALDYCCDRCTIDIQKKYPGNHTNWWNRNKVIRMLNKAGFKDVYVSGYQQSQSPVMRDNTLFDSTHPRISLYVEAIK